MPRRALIAVVALAALAACFLAAAAPYWLFDDVLWAPLAVYVAVAGSFMGSGLVAWFRRPANRTGPLMVLVGFLWLVPDLRWVPGDVPWTLAQWFQTSYQPVLGYLVLAYPAGRLLRRSDRWIMALAFAWNLVNNPVQMLFTDFYDCGCSRRNLLLVHDNPHLAHQLSVASSDVSVALIALIALLIVRQWWRATVAARWVMAPALWAVGPAAGYLALGQFGLVVNYPETFGFRLYNYGPIALVVFPIGLLIGVLRTRVSYAGVVRMVRELSGPLEPGDVRQALAAALNDPQLDIYYWSTTHDAYVDIHGTPTDPYAVTGRTVRVVPGEAAPLATLVIDPALAEEVGFIDAVVAAARLALENESLQSEVRAQLTQLRGAASRIVEAGEVERRRIERDLHDGAQQRLLALSLSLASTRQRLDGPEQTAMRDVLNQAGEQLQEAITELRELARGIHPVLLTQEGLGPALQALADRATLPVEFRCLPQRYPETVEATAYFIAAEALTNAMRHSGADRVLIDVEPRDERLHVRIHDTGVGGADVTRGSGLRGLTDRVAAIDGTLSIESTPGTGTTITASLPCG